MKLINNHMKGIMLVCGALTLTMISVAIAPQTALSSMFGGTLEGPIAEVIVRNWGALIALMGALLVYGAFKPQDRPLILTMVGFSKLIFVGLVVANGFGQQLAVAVSGDLVMVAIFIVYLLSAQPD